MSNNTCPIEPLISTRYCQLSVCKECSVVNLTLPGRITLQFDTHQFVDLANAFQSAALILKNNASSNQQTIKIVKLNQLH